MDSQASSQFNIRSLMVLMTSVVVWITFQSWSYGFTPMGSMIFAILIGGIGGIGHLAFVYWLRSRFTVLGITFLLLLLISTVIATFGSLTLSDSFYFITYGIYSPCLRLSWPILILCMASTAAMAPRHSLSPSLPNAIITSFGVAIWYVTGTLFSIGDYFGA